ncbi:protein quick-to-court isoform X2 [Microplitis demolitor]|uniref:protein quick-to-court isoform X2 n=1 Tax=Microplitis demolitor TaxID=69319 RepID=UPI0004CC90A2|nr:protein quick-to-court isoform X2 [Microplitis demolitor]
MVQQRSERAPSSLRLNQSESVPSGTRAPMTSPTSQPSSPRPVNGDSPLGAGSPAAHSTLNSSISPVSSTGNADSRIPRPSPTSLRRSASMRVRGERVQHLRTTGSSLGPGPGVGSLSHQHHYHRHNHIQQQTEIFPAITENGLDSPRHRSFSLSLTPARPRFGHAASSTSAGGNGESLLSAGAGDDSDVDSVKSYGSAYSTASACDHAHFALNGTTWSGRSRKYVVHCSNYNGDTDQYLTPTQRNARQLRKLQSLLNEAKKEIEEKDREILRLTKEVVELRLYKASLNSPDDRTDSSDALTVRENNPFSPESPSRDLPEESCSSEIQSPRTPDHKFPTAVTPTATISINNNNSNANEFGECLVSSADSGHFEDDSIHSKDSIAGASAVDGHVPARSEAAAKSTAVLSQSNNVIMTLSDDERKKIVDLYEQRIEEMHRRHIDELQELKQKHNDKVESLLNQLSEINTRYCELRPSLDAAEVKVRDFEAELERTKTQLDEQKALFEEQEERNKQMYLKMYAKGQEAARLELNDPAFEQTREMPNVTVTELLQQLSVTQAELENVKAMYRRIIESKNKTAIDPDITLQFLKSAFYYFLTDRENHDGHLNAIESILGFTDNEKLRIERIYGSTRK